MRRSAAAALQSALSRAWPPAAAWAICSPAAAAPSTSCWPGSLLARAFSAAAAAAAAADAGAAAGAARPAAADAAAGPAGPAAAAAAQPSLSQRAELARSLARGGRFYNTVRVAPAADGGYQVLLGTHPARTPARRLLVLPTLPLALAAAAEWEWLEKGKPILHAMPLMSLAATAIDQPKARSKVIDNLVKYCHTDAACVRHEPGPMQQRQAKVFDPLLQWAREELGWHLQVSDSICGVTQPAACVEAVERYLQGLDAWRLAAVEQLTAASKSVVVAAAAAAGRLTAEQVLGAARLEEDAQMEEWGSVEAGHDLDIADMRTRVGAPVVLLRLLGPAPAGQQRGR